MRSVHQIGKKTPIVECLEQLNWDSQQGRDLATSGCNKQTFQLGQSHSYIMRKVWNHQIWIQNKLGFMVVHTRQNWYNIHLSVYITWYIQLCCPHDIATRESLISIRNIWVLHAALTKNLLCWSQFTFTWISDSWPVILLRLDFKNFDPCSL